MKKGDKLELNNGMIVEVKTINNDIFGCEVVNKPFYGYKIGMRIIVNKNEFKK